MEPQSDKKSNAKRMYDLRHNNAAYRKKENEKKREKRYNNSDYRKKENEKNAERIREKRRNNSDYREKLNKAKRDLRRNNADYREKENEKTAERMQALRLNLSYRENKNKKQRDYRKKLLKRLKVIELQILRNKNVSKCLKRRGIKIKNDADNEKKRENRIKKKGLAICSCQQKKNNVHKYIKSTNKYRLSDQDYLKALDALSISQEFVYSTLIEKIRSNEPFTVFVTGNAGTGKSALIHVINEHICRFTNNEASISRTAFTGRAACNIQGRTLHSVFCLPFDDQPPTELELNILKRNLRHLRYLVIDEISMVGSALFTLIEHRLRQIRNTPDRPFGGISVLCFGDFNQLPPVKDQHVTENALWGLFQTFQLTEVIRQREDIPFTQFLERVANNTTNDNDQMFIESRRNAIPPPSAIHLFCLNAEMKRYNRSKLETIDSEKLCLSKNSYLKVNMRCMLTRNICINDGLVNGAMGTLRTIDICDDCTNAVRLGVEFDDENVGQMTRNRHGTMYTPIDIIKIKGKSTFPITMAEGITIHKAQGMTLENVVVHESPVMSPNQFYVAVSRVERSNNLFLIPSIMATPCTHPPFSLG